MSNIPFSNFKYQELDTTISGVHEVCVSYKFKEKNLRRIVFVKDKKKVNAINEAKKIINQEIRNGRLLKYSKKMSGLKVSAHPGLKIALAISAIAAVGVGGTFAYMHFNHESQPDVPPLTTVNIKFTDETKENATIDKLTMDVGGTLKAKITMTKVGTAIDETKFTVTSASTLTPEVDYSLKWRAISPTVPKEYDFEILNGKKITKDVIISAPLKDMPTTITIDPDSIDKIKFDEDKEPIIGKDYENTFTLLQRGTLDSTNPCVVTVGENPLQIGNDFEVTKINDTQYKLFIQGSKITNKIVVSEVLIVQDFEYSIVFDADSSPLISISPKIAKKGLPYNGTITIKKDCNRIDVTKLTAKVGETPLSASDFACTFHRPMSLTTQYDFKTLNSVNETITIHAELVEMNREVDETTFDKATDITTLDTLQVSSRLTGGKVKNSYTSEEYYPNVYHRYSYNIDSQACADNRYIIKDNDNYNGYEIEDYIGACQELSYVTEDDYYTPADDSFAMFATVNQVYKNTHEGKSILNAFEYMNEEEKYYCEDPFKGDPTFEGAITDISLKFGNDKLLYSKMTVQGNSSNPDLQTIEEYFEYANYEPKAPRVTEISYEVTEGEWQSVLRPPLQDDECINIYDSRTVADYRFKGSNLYWGPGVAKTHTYYEWDGKNTYSKYVYNEISSKYEKSPSSKEEFAQGNFNTRLNEAIPNVFLDQSSFTYVSGENRYRGTIDGYEYVFLKFMNNKIAKVDFGINGYAYAYEFTRYGLDLNIPEI